MLTYGPALALVCSIDSAVTSPAAAAPVGAYWSLSGISHHDTSAVRGDVTNQSGSSGVGEARDPQMKPCLCY